LEDSVQVGVFHGAGQQETAAGFQAVGQVGVVAVADQDKQSDLRADAFAVFVGTGGRKADGPEDGVEAEALGQVGGFFDWGRDDAVASGAKLSEELTFAGVVGVDQQERQGVGRSAGGQVRLGLIAAD
jgi:hypothetical protein